MKFGWQCQRQFYPPYVGLVLLQHRQFINAWLYPADRNSRQYLVRKLRVEGEPPSHHLYTRAGYPTYTREQPGRAIAEDAVIAFSFRSVTRNPEAVPRQVDNMRIQRFTVRSDRLVMQPINISSSSRPVPERQTCVISRSGLQGNSLYHGSCRSFAAYFRICYPSSSSFASPFSMPEYGVRGGDRENFGNRTSTGQVLEVQVLIDRFFVQQWLPWQQKRSAGIDKACLFFRPAGRLQFPDAAGKMFSQRSADFI